MKPRVFWKPHEQRRALTTAALLLAKGITKSKLKAFNMASDMMPPDEQGRDRRRPPVNAMSTPEMTWYRDAIDAAVEQAKAVIEAEAAAGNKEPPAPPPPVAEPAPEAPPAPAPIAATPVAPPVAPEALTAAVQAVIAPPPLPTPVAAPVVAPAPADLLALPFTQLIGAALQRLLIDTLQPALVHALRSPSGQAAIQQAIETAFNAPSPGPTGPLTDAQQDRNMDEAATALAQSDDRQRAAGREEDAPKVNGNGHHVIPHHAIPQPTHAPYHETDHDDDDPHPPADAWSRQGALEIATGKAKPFDREAPRKIKPTLCVVGALPVQQRQLLDQFANDYRFDWAEHGEKVAVLRSKVRNADQVYVFQMITQDRKMAIKDEMKKHHRADRLHWLSGTTGELIRDLNALRASQQPESTASALGR